jgi:hypothetical protein
MEWMFQWDEDDHLLDTLRRSMLNARSRTNIQVTMVLTPRRWQLSLAFLHTIIRHFRSLVRHLFHDIRGQNRAENESTSCCLRPPSCCVRSQSHGAVRVKRREVHSCSTVLHGCMIFHRYQLAVPSTVECVVVP